MPPHCHAFHELVGVIAGNLSVMTPEGMIEVGSGDVLFYEEGMIHEERSDQHVPVYTRFISFSWPYAPLHRLAQRVHDTHGRILALLDWLFDERYTLSATGAQVREAMVQTILAEYLRLQAYEEPDVVSRTRDYVRRHLDDPLSVEALAGYAGMSKYHFIRTYKALCARTPMEDVRGIRVERARDMLLTTDLPLKTIATNVGCANEQHLSRLVRHFLGMSPGDIRRRVTRNKLPIIEEHTPTEHILISP
jgi:AraC-like DNA-binding protein